MLVGNDVVDLRDPETRPDSVHPRFDERVFTADEREGLTDRTTAHLTRWRLWAAKESAFKVARKADPGVRFLPRSFEVRLVASDQAIVAHSMGRFHVSFAGAEEWVHAIATLADDPAGSDGRRVQALLGRMRRGRRVASSASARVRAMARSAVASVLSISPSEIEIATLGRIPVALRQKSPLPIDVSLSHHGRFLACVLGRPPAPCPVDVPTDPAAGPFGKATAES